MAPLPGDPHDASEELRSVNDELRRKLVIAEALSSYQSSVAERRRLEAVDSVRPLESRLAYVEPLYNELFREYTETLAYVDDLEEAKEETEAKLLELQKRADAELRTSRSECAAIQGKLRAAEKELLDIRSTTKSSAASLVSEKNSAVNELADIQLEHQLILERSKALETELEQVEKEAAVKVKSLQSEISECKKELKSLQTKHDKAQKQAAAGLKKAETQIEALQRELESEKTAAEEKIQAATEKADSSKVTKKEISELKASLAKETKAREKAEKGVATLKAAQEKLAQKGEESKVTKKELSDLRVALAKETKARERAEKEQAEEQKAREEEQAAREKTEADLVHLQEEHAKALKKDATTAKGKKELSELKAALAKETKAREAAERNVARHQEEQAKAAQKETAPKGVKKDLLETKAALAKETEARKSAEDDLARLLEEHTTADEELVRLRGEFAKAAQKEPTPKAGKKELTDLKAALAKEIKAREKAERDLVLYKTDQQSKQEITQKQLDAARAKVRKLEDAATAAKTTTTKVPLDNPRKRTLPLTMDALENSTKKPRTKPATKESEFSVTPFLKRQAIIADAPGAADTTAVIADDTIVATATGDKSTMVPTSIIPQPMRSLFANNARKKKPIKSTAIPEEEEAAAPVPAAATKTVDICSPVESDDEIEEEDSMLMARPPPKASKPKGKAPPKPKPATRVPRLAKPQSALLFSSPAPAPAPAPAVKLQPQRRKKAVGEGSFMGGIRPTLFDDDGSGKLDVNLDDASQGLGKKSGTAMPRLVPNMASAFSKEISPPKKRPAALGRLFGGK